MKKQILAAHIAFVLSVLMTVSVVMPSLSSAAVPSVRRVKAAEALTLPDDPGGERLSGVFLPAEESNIAQAMNEASIASDDASAAADSSGFITSDDSAGSRLIRPSALSSLKGYRVETSPFNNKTYTHASNFDGMNIYHGIDVSYHQGTIDFNKVRDAGISYVILRLGYRGYSNGTLATDSKFTTYIQDAAAAGLPIGVYFWTEAISVEEAAEEANYVISVLEPYRQYITMPVTIDWELNSKSRHAGLSKELNTQICTTFCDTVAANGYLPMIYANVSDLNNNLDGIALGEKYEIWVARYNNIVNNATAQFYGNYCMWQYDSSGSVDGISGNVDMNFWYTVGSPAVPAFTHGSTDGAITIPPTASPSPETEDIDEIGDVTDLTASTASKKITLSWKAVKNADGYQIKRKDTYDGSFTTVKTIENGETTTWNNTGLDKKHEYYYKVRALHKNSDETIYSENFASITAATKASAKTGITKKAITLYKKPASALKKLITLPKGTPMEYVGVTHLSDDSTFHHFRYYTPSKTYDGYRTAKGGLTYYQQGNTTAKLNFRKTAGVSGKLITSIPKGTALPLLGTKKVKGATWYKTCYATKQKTVVTGYVAGSYIRK